MLVRLPSRMCFLGTKKWKNECSSQSREVMRGEPRMLDDQRRKKKGPATTSPVALMRFLYPRRDFPIET